MTTLATIRARVRQDLHCPKCGPRPRIEFKRILRDVGHAEGRMVPVDVYVHQKSSCRAKVYMVKAERRILVSA